MVFPAKGVVTLKTNLSEYPVTKAIRDGRVASDTVKLDICGPDVAHEGFKPMVRESKFDAGELAIITFLQAKCYGKPYVILPAPISGRYQHHVIGYNSALGELKPKDIEGKTVGVRSYAQTTGLWCRGVLKHEYGVDLDKVTWGTFEEAHLAEHTDPKNCIRYPKGSKKLAQMMYDGDVAAAILGADMPKDPNVKTLVPNPHEAADEWGKRTGVLPINHIFAVRAELSKERPDVIAELYRMIKEGRAAAGPAATKNFPPFGIEANRKTLQLAIDWSAEQKIIPRKLTVDELFDDTMRKLKD